MNKIVKFGGAVLALGFVGCATPSIPYVSEYLIRNLPTYWASRPSSVEEVVTVHNPLVHTVDITVVCVRGSFYDGKPFHTFEKVPAGGEGRALFTISSTDAIVGSCSIPWVL